MKHKTILYRSSQLLSSLNEAGINCFGVHEAYSALPESKKSTVRQLLTDMTRRGLLMRIKEGVYCVIPYGRGAENFMPDWHLLAGHLVGKSDYYIGYYSALQVHNLITQPSLKEQIVVSKQIKPSEILVRDIPFQFIYHNEKHFFGSKKIWIDSFNKVQCSDLEKTFVDCLYKPDYAGEIVETAKAIFAAKDKINFDRLLEYVRKFGSQAVVKRLGFLLETVEIKTAILEDLREMKTASSVLLDTELPDEGRAISRWSIRQNLETETIKSAINT